jgi:hypothetical protein
MLRALGPAYRRDMKVIGYALAVVLGVYLMARAVAEWFLLDMSDPASYRNDWGGPGLLGVLAVHCGPGLLALILFAYVGLRYRRRRVHARGVHPR